MRSRSRLTSLLYTIVPEDADVSRQRILDAFLLGLVTLTLLVMVIMATLTLLGYADLLGTRAEVQFAYTAMLVLLGGIAALLVVRRFVSTDLASVLLLVLWVVCALVSDTPENVVDGRNLVMFVVPIALAAVLLPPWSTFAAATFVTLVLTIYGCAMLGPHVPNVFAVGVFYITAAGMWLAMRAVARSIAAMRASELRYRTTFEQASVGLAEIGLDGRYLRVNQRLCDILGYTAEELLSFAPLDITHPDDREQTARAHERLLRATTRGSEEGGAAGESIELYKRYLRQDGRVVWVEVRVAISRSPDGQINHLIGVYVDVTARRTAEEARHESERRAELALMGADLGMWSYDVPTDEYTIDERWASMLGFALADVGNPREAWDRLTHPEDRLLIGQALRAHAAGETPFYELEYRMRSQDGVYRWVLSRGRVVQRDAAGEPLRVSGTHLDVTDRHEARQEADSQARFPNENPSPVLRIAASGEVLYANDAAAPLLETWKRRVGDAAPAEWARRVSAALEAHERSAHDVACDHRIYALVLAPIVDGAYVNVYAHDVTERRRLEEHLRQTTKMEAVGRLAGGIAHDFNNLLTVINGYAEFLMSEIHEANPLYADVAEIAAAGNRAATLTRQLLAFSRRQMRQPQKVDLNSVVREMDSLLRRLLGEDINLVLSLGGALDTIQADPGQVEQVIMNLAVNARDAMPDGGVLTLQTANIVWEIEHAERHMGTAPGQYVMLIVSDTGVGMSEEVQEHLFEPFFTTKGLGQGTGLGLAAVYGIVRQNDGFIYAYSEPELGTTFKVFFPRHAQGLHPSDLDDDDASALPRGREAILVVEDDEGVRVMASRALSELGYRVTAAAHPDDALAICLAGHALPDLILTDLIMPGMTGTDLIAALKSEGVEVPVLYMSGYPMSTLGNHGVLKAGTHLLQKPFGRAQVAARVRDLLDEKQG